MADKKYYVLSAVAVLMILLTAAIPISVSLIPSAMPMPPVAAAEADVKEPMALGEPYREMRGLWIPTVNNNTFPTKSGLGAPELAAELDAIVDFANTNRFGAILFQVRPEADALYSSEIFPASRVVSGKCGKAADGGFDCLSYLIEKAKPLGIEVHAWVNPLRVAANEKVFNALPENSPALMHPECVTEYADGKYYFDAGQPYVRELVALGVREICENYQVDGVIFDDYFYPYPKDGAPFDDAKTYAEYGGKMSLADFRRDSVNKLVKLCYDTVKSVDKNIEFGVSPFGIWQNYDGENGGSMTNGLEAYDAIYCDALAWANGGYVDYLAPQIYWSFDKESAPFDVLAEWWSRALDGTGVKLYINHGVYKYDEGEMQSGEMARQIEFSKQLYSYHGGMYFGYAALKNNTGGVLDEINSGFENAVHFEHTDSGKLTASARENGAAAVVSGYSNRAYPISVNGITPLRFKDGSYTLTLALVKGDNLISVSNGEERIEIVLKY